MTLEIAIDLIYVKCGDILLYTSLLRHTQYISVGLAPPSFVEPPDDGTGPRWCKR